MRSSVLMDCLRQLRKIVREEKNQDTTVYTSSIQDESTSSLLLINPLRRIPITQLGSKNYKNIYIILEPKTKELDLPIKNSP